MKRPQVTYNVFTFRILLKLQSWTSASQMFVTSSVPTFYAVLKNFMYKFMCHLTDSKNVIIKALTGCFLIVIWIICVLGHLPERGPSE